MKQRVGVVGVGRGYTLCDYCMHADNAELVAVCDIWEEGLAGAKEALGGENIRYYSDYEEFLKDGRIDVVVLANYATEHAPFAIRAMRAGKDVVSEVLPVQNMAEAVELIETVEQTGRRYCYEENFCFRAGPREMKAKLESGELGTFEYAEGEYMHNCEPIWTLITHGERDHWRCAMSAFFYCTHSAGPIVHMAPTRPVRVVGVEMPFNARMARMGARAGNAAVELITFEDGTAAKSLHGIGPSKCSEWYSVYGSKGRIETAREDAQNGNDQKIYANLDPYEGANKNIVTSYRLHDELAEKAKGYGHGGGDYICMYHIMEYLSGREGDVIDVYEALDMWMIGFFGYISVLEGGVTQDIPDLRDPAQRERFRNDRRCTDPKAAGDSLLPSYSKGTPEIPEETYEKYRRAWAAEENNGRMRKR